jgi:hypothetical protein
VKTSVLGKLRKKMKMWFWFKDYRLTL